ncbi:MAG: MerR family transcriptional regulator [Erysipelotrichaceae bacterium]
MNYTIKQVSEMTNIPATTLRYYDKEGLLPFLERKESGYRVFHDSDLKMLQVLECLKSTGMSIDEMKQFSKWVQEGDDSLKQRYEMFLERKKAVELQMQDLQKMLDILEHKCKYYENAMKEGTERRIMETDKLPHADEFICRRF